MTTTNRNLRAFTWALMATFGVGITLITILNVSLITGGR